MRKTYKDLVYIIALRHYNICFGGFCKLALHKQLTRPLTEMSCAANKLRKETSAQNKRKAQRAYRASQAFNIMSGKFEQTEPCARILLQCVARAKLPLTSMRGFIQGLLDGTIEKEKQNAYLQVVLDETDRLSKLVSSLLKLSRMDSESEPISLSVFDIHEMIRLIVITRMNSLEKKNHEIILNFDEEPLYVRSDKDKIEQVLINLLDNSIKYTQENGQISILTDETSKDIVTVTVKDNGIGILESDLPYVFDRFYMAEKAHTAGKGTGLGLAICKKIIDRLEQKIWATSSGAGTEIHFTLEKAGQEVKKVAH